MAGGWGGRAESAQAACSVTNHRPSSKASVSPVVAAGPGTALNAWMPAIAASSSPRWSISSRSVRTTSALPVVRHAAHCSSSAARSPGTIADVDEHVVDEATKPS